MRHGPYWVVRSLSDNTRKQHDSMAAWQHGSVAAWHPAQSSSLVCFLLPLRPLAIFRERSDHAMPCYADIATSLFQPTLKFAILFLIWFHIDSRPMLPMRACRQARQAHWPAGGDRRRQEKVCTMQAKRCPWCPRTTLFPYCTQFFYCVHVLRMHNRKYRPWVRTGRAPASLGALAPRSTSTRTWLDAHRASHMARHGSPACTTHTPLLFPRKLGWLSSSEPTAPVCCSPSRNVDQGLQRLSTMLSCLVLLRPSPCASPQITSAQQA